MIWITWCAVHWRTFRYARCAALLILVTQRSGIAAPGQTTAVMFRWSKQRRSDALRKRWEGEAAQRVANVFRDRHLPERPSLDGYTVRELSPDQAAQLFSNLSKRPQ